jgi:hypothetical protein
MYKRQAIPSNGARQFNYMDSAVLMIKASVNPVHRPGNISGADGE